MFWPSETARMGYLVEDLLTLAKANDGGLTLEDADVDLDDVAGPGDPPPALHEPRTGSRRSSPPPGSRATPAG